MFYLFKQQQQQQQPQQQQLQQQQSQQQQLQLQQQQLQQQLQQLSFYHNSAPLSFIDMVYKDYSRRYAKMFSSGTINVPQDLQNVSVNSTTITTPPSSSSSSSSSPLNID
ncbi:hypothetical protein ACTFIR_004896 [Dictyostelium discoideum]